MGLPIDKFIAAVNINKTFYDFLQNGNYNPKTSIKTMSNAMDVGNPSNFIRIKYLYPTLSEIKKDILSYYYNDKQTIESIHEVYNKYNYLMDPHTSIGYCAIKQLSKVVSVSSSQRCCRLGSGNLVTNLARYRFFSVPNNPGPVFIAF